MLTRKQYELLLFINRRLAEDGVSPSFEEMKDALNLKSKSGIHRLISGLEERGFIRRLAHRARALEVVKLPEETSVAARRSGGAVRSQPFFAHRHPRRLQSRRSWEPPPPTPMKRSSCRFTAGSPPARRSRRCAIPAIRSRCRPP